jgi:hypothetical protein
MRMRAARYRSMAIQIVDAQAIEALRGLADEYEARAKEIEAQGQVGDDGEPIAGPPESSPG